MIDLNKALAAKKASEKIDVVPSDRLFDELGRNTYNYGELLAELIDNSIAAREPGHILNISIDIFIDKTGKAREMIFQDNAQGIPQNRLGAAISPAAIQSENSLNEHGMGMKQAIAALGKLKYLATKTKAETKGRLITEFKYGEISVFATDFQGENGTEIAVTDLKPIVTTHSTSYTRSIVPYLGARYRRFLKPAIRQLELKINFKKFESPEDTTLTWTIEDIEPIYFHPSTRRNEPVIAKYRITGATWAAELTFGYSAAKKDEFEELGLEEPNKFHPYRNSLKTQGLDVIFHDRVILFHQLSELGIVSSPHNDYNTIRGEIDLKHGFSTAVTKNSIIHDENFVQCIDAVTKILQGKGPGPGNKTKDYIVQKTYPEELPEVLLRDRLTDWLQNNPIQSRNNVHTEYKVEGIDGSIDIFADEEVWELKTNQASALDVYQLFMYMDVGGAQKGYLVAKEFTTGARVAMEFISKNHGKQIILAKLSDFPINHPPDEVERQNYY